MTLRRRVTIVIHHDGDIESKTFSLSSWLYNTLKYGSMTFVGLVVLGLVAYAPVARTAASVPSMNDELVRLRAENQQVAQLARTLNELEGRYQQVRSALGADLLEGDEGDSTRAAHTAYPLFARLPQTPTGRETAAQPARWPLDSLFEPGVLTRGYIPPRTGVESHSGVDIAVRTGTPIRAVGDGLVKQAGYDQEYGWFVLIAHADRYETMYGHASRLLVVTGDSVLAGKVIALTGNTGRSTAPHLHFELRSGGTALDPLSQPWKEP